MTWHRLEQAGACPLVSFKAEGSPWSSGVFLEAVGSTPTSSAGPHPPPSVFLYSRLRHQTGLSFICLSARGLGQCCLCPLRFMPLPCRLRVGSGLFLAILISLSYPRTETEVSLSLCQRSSYHQSLTVPSPLAHRNLI